MTPALLAVDPGIRGCGVALFDNAHGNLLGAAYLLNPLRTGHEITECLAMAEAIDEWLHFRWSEVAVDLRVEWPQVYTAGKSKGDPNVSLVPLAGVDAALVGVLSAKGKLGRVAQYLPHDWKGSIDGDDNVRRIRQRLTLPEHGRIVFPDNACDGCRAFIGMGSGQLSVDAGECKKKSCLAHNVYDAVGVGLKHLNRFELKKAIAR